MGLITQCLCYDFIILVLCIFASIYIFFQRRFQYWTNRKVPIVETPIFPYGNFKGVSRVKNMSEIVSDLYEKRKNQKVVGVYFFSKPALIICEPDIIKSVLVREFSSFHDRGLIYPNIKLDPLAQSLFFLSGHDWRNIRTKMTPTFTSGKIKTMFPILFDVGDQLVDVLNEHVDKPDVEIKDILARYTCDVISTVVFGLQPQSLKDPKNEFRRMGDFLNNPDLLLAIKRVIIFTFPRIQKYLPIKFIPEETNDYFIKTVHDVIEYREKNNVKRNDFMELLMQLKTLGYIPDADTLRNSNEQRNDTPLTLELTAAQAFAFFLAGFETTSSAMQFALYELALQPDLQKRVQDEIKQITNKHGSVTYEALHEMELLDRVVSETLRKYPLAPFLMRDCTKTYTIPDTDIVVEKGIRVWVPLAGIHMDPQYYPDPHKFDPDRFLPENVSKRHPYVYLPFGDGPRSCIGNRFALVQTKAGLSLILSKFTVSPSARTRIPIKINPKAATLSALGGMYLNITRRETEKE